MDREWRAVLALGRFHAADEGADDEHGRRERHPPTPGVDLYRLGTVAFDARPDQGLDLVEVVVGRRVGEAGQQLIEVDVHGFLTDPYPYPVTHGLLESLAEKSFRRQFEGFAAGERNTVASGPRS